MHTEMTMRKTAVVADFPLNIIFCLENTDNHIMSEEKKLFTSFQFTHPLGKCSLEELAQNISCNGQVKSSELSHNCLHK